MMPPPQAQRYAKALFSAALAAEQVDIVGKDLLTIEATLKGHPDLMTILGHPRVPHSNKEKLVQSAFQGRVHELTSRFLGLVLEKGREEVLPALAAEYDKLVATWRNELTAEVRTAVPLQDGERKFITEELARQTGRKVLLKEVVDPALLGGLIVRYGDKQIDGSVRHHLEQVAAELKAVRVS